MSSTNPNSKPANLITAWTQRVWCWNVVFMVFLQRILDPVFPNWIVFISSENRIFAANVLHYLDRLCYNNVRLCYNNVKQAYQRNSLSMFE